MQRAAKEVMQDIIFAAVVDAITALRTASRGVPNTLLRDLQSLHPNTTFGDLPKELQDAIGETVRSAFTKLHKEGYSVSPSQGVPARPDMNRGDRPRRPDGAPSRGRPTGRPQRPNNGPGGAPRGKPGGGGNQGGGNPHSS